MKVASDPNLSSGDSRASWKAKTFFFSFFFLGGLRSRWGELWFHKTESGGSPHQSLLSTFFHRCHMWHQSSTVFKSNRLPPENNFLPLPSAPSSLLFSHRGFYFPLAGRRWSHLRGASPCRRCLLILRSPPRRRPPGRDAEPPSLHLGHSQTPKRKQQPLTAAIAASRAHECAAVELLCQYKELFFGLTGDSAPSDFCFLAFVTSLSDKASVSTPCLWLRNHVSESVFIETARSANLDVNER